MKKGWKTPARRALLQQVASAYRTADASQKKQILTDFLSKTGYVRKYAVWVLNHAEDVLQEADTSRSRYGPEVQQALVLARETLNRICTKRLIPFLPDIIDTLEQDGEAPFFVFLFMFLQHSHQYCIMVVLARNRSSHIRALLSLCTTLLSEGEAKCRQLLDGALILRPIVALV